MEINYCESGHPFTTERCVQRLITEYNKHKNLIIAFDFDNTVFDYHKEGNQYEYDDVIDLLKYCYDLGMTLVLYTCEENIDKINRIISNPHGIILVTGPTGSGKSTTLYSVLFNIK